MTSTAETEFKPQLYPFDRKFSPNGQFIGAARRLDVMDLLLFRPQSIFGPSDGTSMPVSRALERCAELGAEMGQPELEWLLFHPRDEIPEYCRNKCTLFPRARWRGSRGQEFILGLVGNGSIHPEKAHPPWVHRTIPVSTVYIPPSGNYGRVVDAQSVEASSPSGMVEGTLNLDRCPSDFFQVLVPV